MSIQTLKHKTRARYNPHSRLLSIAPGQFVRGFSLNGNLRVQSGVGRSSAFSTDGTRLRGLDAQGYGSRGGPFIRAGRYAASATLVGPPDSAYLKSTVLTAGAAMARQVAPARFTVQPTTSTQGLYVHTLTSQNDVVFDVNEDDTYKEDVRGPEVGRCTGFHKEIRRARSSGAYTTHIQFRCAAQTAAQRPWPPAANGGACTSGLAQAVR